MKALKLNDSYLPYNIIKDEMSSLQSPFHPITEEVNVQSTLLSNINYLPQFTEASESQANQQSESQFSNAEIGTVIRTSKNSIINLTQDQLENHEDSESNYSEDNQGVNHSSQMQEVIHSSQIPEKNHRSSSRHSSRKSYQSHQSENNSEHDSLASYQKNNLNDEIDASMSSKILSSNKPQNEQVKVIPKAKNDEISAVAEYSNEEEEFAEEYDDSVEYDDVEVNSPPRAMLA